MSGEMAKAMWYFTLPFDILALAMVGYYLAKRLNYHPGIGVLIGTICGTILMWGIILKRELISKGR